MNPLRLAFVGTFFTTSAIAHPGHLDVVSGHSHHVALGAMVVVVAIAAGAIVTRLRHAKR